MTPKQAQIICEMQEYPRILGDAEEREGLLEGNPEYLDAIEALMALAKLEAE